ncbi:hypothetical protein EUX98_g5019 [Antrodiella citrinella]|uniref:Altered inheritance of mitochondria protein 23, mitochondrial n=1 Tax=Antrodiella citrinella TaxID=2447956 RepID=A0A4S4MV02_9APHY|nr:hypothetical protein EUX98_g5019 [Antrodiella citrinella]
MTPTNVVLRRLLPDKEVRRRYSVQLVSLSPEPIVRLVNTGEQYRKEKEKKQRAQQRAKLSGEKEIQLTWDTEGPDHQRKLDQARESLAEGMRVDLIHAPKRGTRHRMTKEDMALCAQSTLDALADVGKERREKQVGPRITAIYLEPLAATVTENEVLIPLGAPQAIFQRRVSEVQKVLAAGGKVKLTFAEEKKSKDEVEKNGLPEDTREGAPWSGGLVKLITKELKQQTAGEEKWTRKRKEAFVDAIITKLGSEAQEWKPRDDWKASTTLYLRKSGSD